MVGNEVRTGLLYLADGRPAAGARVRVYRVDHVPDIADPALVTTADDRGQYALDSLAAGEYNILGEKGGQVSYLDSVIISISGSPIPADTLEQPGSLTGLVGLQPNHDPRTVTVQVLGTDVQANVDEAGRFRLGRLARGSYSLRVVTTLPEYTPLFRGISVRPASDDTLADTLKLPFTGIPVVRGLTSLYDTLAGAVHLAWQGVKYRDFSEYLVFRDVATAMVPSSFPIAVTRDTAHIDALGIPTMDGGFSSEDRFGRTYRYRVRVRNLSDQVGLSYGFTEMHALSPSVVATTLDAKLVGVKWDAATQVDSTEVQVALASSRGLASMSWALGRADSVVATHDLGGRKEAMESLKFGWGREGIYAVHVRAKDMAGTEWSRILWVPGNRAPDMSLRLPDTVKTGLELMAPFSYYDPDGDKLAITAEGLPPWLRLDVAKGTLQGTPRRADTEVYPGIMLRVHDGRRAIQSGPHTLVVKTNPWEKRTRMPFEGRAEFGLRAVPLKDHILVLRYSPGALMYSLYDPAADTWTWQRNAELPEMEAIHWGHAWEGKVLLIGSTRVRGNDPIQRTMAFIYDPKTDTWAGTPSGADYSHYLSGMSHEGKLVMVTNLRNAPSDNRVVLTYDPATGAWSTRGWAPAISRPACLLSGGKLLALVGLEYSPISVDAFDLAAGTWETGIHKGPSGWTMFSAAPLGGKMYLMGGYWEQANSQGGYETSRTRVMAFDPATGSFVRKSDRIFGLLNSECVPHGGKIYCFGGSKAERTHFSPDFYSWMADVEAYDPQLEE